MTRPPADDPQLSLNASFVRGVAGLPRADWDRLVGDGSPFSEWAYLHACEAASATPAHGYLPHHMVVYDGDRLIAAAPMYIKSDGRAEFIYDYYWYHFAHQAGFEYYPKLVSMCPFTPVAYTHFMVDPDYPKAPLVTEMVQQIENWAFNNEIHGIHYLFIDEAEADLLGDLGYVQRASFQLAMHNRGFDSFDDYLAGFRSRKRVTIKRELRRLDEQQLTLELLEGDAISEADLEAMYDFYSITCRAYGTGSHYLKAETWQLLWQDWRERLVVVLARDPRGERVGGALLVQKAGQLYGRYWGALQDLRSLYFNVSYYEPIRFMIERGLETFHCGFGNVHYKHARGFDPCLNLSMHKFADRRLQELIAESLERERPEVYAQMAAVREQSSFKPR